MNRRYVRWLVLGSLVLALGIGSFLATTVFTQMANADDPGKPRGRNAPEPQSSLTAQERAQLYKPGRPWDGVGRGDLTEAHVSEFSDYPLFWLGEAFAGYNLQAVRHVKYSAPPGAKSLDRVTFIYGECTPPSGADRCPVPAQVHVQPVCAVLPDEIVEDARQGALQTLPGGAKLQRFTDGHIMIWAGAVVLDVAVTADPSLVNRAIAELRGIGRNPIRGGQSLAAPDFGPCER